MGDNQIYQFACGILYNHSFKLLDKWGSIADCILYNNAHFSPEYFPTISTQYTTSRTLTNDKEGHSIQLTANNLIYTHVVQKNFDKEYVLFRKKVEKFLVPKIIEGNGLITRRIGVIFSCQVNDTVIQEFASRYFKPEYKNVTDFRFSRKESTIAGSSFSDKSDFINKIYSVGTMGDGITGISFDYQAHYNPPREDITKQITSVLKIGKDLLKEEILIIGEENE